MGSWTIGDCATIDGCATIVDCAGWFDSDVSFSLAGEDDEFGGAGIESFSSFMRKFSFSFDGWSGCVWIVVAIGATANTGCDGGDSKVAEAGSTSGLRRLTRTGRYDDGLSVASS